MNKNKIKKKLINHLLKNGKKQISEKILKNSFKSLQKVQKKSHKEIFKQTIVNSTPTFRIIKLKKKKSNLEIPAFLSSYTYRTSWGIKYLIKTLAYKNRTSGNKIFYKQLEKEILSSAEFASETIKFKEELQKTTLQKKKYFKYYRW